ncbi:MAG: diguanylate cyclase, partial [Acidobacteria bacterium]|nr:diguanylate cyclase [Acidobacteriota bacterium]
MAWVGPLALLTAALLLSDVILPSRQASAIVSAFGLTVWALYCWLTYGQELALWTTGFAYLGLLGGWKIRDARKGEAATAAAPRLDELERPRLSQKLQAHSDQAVDGSSIGRWYWDLKDQRLQFSSVWLEITGSDPATESGDPQAWYERIHPIDLGKFRDAISAHVYGNAAVFECQYRMRCGEQGFRWMLTRGTAGKDADGRPVWLTGTQIDVTGLVDRQERSDDQQTDPLTGVLNRRALALLLERACRDARPGSVAVLALDIEKFKLINDSFGMAAGDDTLAALGKRLNEVCAERAACGRQGGDEFAVVIENLEDPAEAFALARRVQESMRRPFHVGKHDIKLGVSVGAALYGQAGVLPDELLRNAELALQKAKSRGDRLTSFDEEMRARALRSYALRSELSGAAERAELELYYQPIYRLSDGALVEAEALLRWRRSSGEAVPAGEFIALAEESGLIGELGEWVMRSACIARRN